MPSQTLLNTSRPPVFCPGCSHEQVLKVLDKTFLNMGLEGNQIAMVSDIGCSGLFDTFFNTHALHGLHGRALTYATGLKVCKPDLNVVVTMGDGGMGIGGAHVLSACRRNLDITLLVLNNFNYGMTGGQYSTTTPIDAVVGSGFLNRLEQPTDIHDLAVGAGAPFVVSCSTYQKDLGDILERAIKFKGFSIVEIKGLCPGRYTKRNKLNPKMIEESLEAQKRVNGEIEANQRIEYGQAYRELTASLKPVTKPMAVEARFSPPEQGLRCVAVLGSAGQRVLTAGELIGLAGLSAGLQVTQKNEYNITVLRGPSISELIISPEPIDYTGSKKPNVVLALAAEGVERRKHIFAELGPEDLVIQAATVELPPTKATVKKIDFKALGIKTVDYSLAGVAALAKMNRVLSMEMLEAAMKLRYKTKILDLASEVVGKVYPAV